MTIRKKPISIRRSKRDGRTMRVLVCFDVCHNGVVLAKIQQEHQTDKWFWYGMKGPCGNTASNPREFEVVKAEALSQCREYLSLVAR